MLSLILVRHGQTDYNKAHRIQGQLDIPLNEAGIEQAKRLRSVLVPLVEQSNIPVRVLSSDLSRAFQTAEIALDGKIDIQPEELLREIHFGSWQGLDHVKLRKEDEEAALRWFYQPEFDYNPHGGESHADLHERMQRFHETKILPQVSDESRRILLFTHGASLSAYLNVVLGTNLRYTLSNCAITEILLTPQGVPRLHLFNMQAHQQPSFYRL